MGSSHQPLELDVEEGEIPSVNIGHSHHKVSLYNGAWVNLSQKDKCRRTTEKWVISSGSPWTAFWVWRW